MFDLIDNIYNFIGSIYIIFSLLILFVIIKAIVVTFIIETPNIKLSIKEKLSNLYKYIFSIKFLIDVLKSLFFFICIFILVIIYILLFWFLPLKLLDNYGFILILVSNYILYLLIKNYNNNKV